MSELNSVQHLRKSGSLPLSRHIYNLFSLIVLFAFSLTLDRFNLISSLSISSPVYLLLIPPPPLYLYHGVFRLKYFNILYPGF